MNLNPSSLLKTYHGLLTINFVRFAMVGGVGFVVNFIGLSFLYHLFKIPILPAQLLSAEVALLCTFVGNNYWAFKGDHRRSFKQKLVAYHMSTWVGVGINTIIVVLLVRYASWYYGFALLAGAAVGLIWNYTLNRSVVFTHKSTEADIILDQDTAT